MLTYLQFAYGEAKGGIAQNEIYMNETPFTYRKMDENRANYTSDRVVEAVAVNATEFTPAWTPVSVDPEDNTKYQIYGEKATDGEWEQLTLTGGKVTFTAGTYTRIKYVYENIVIPQAKLPTIKAHMEGITLEARARRIAVQYSQISAFQA